MWTGLFFSLVLAMLTAYSYSELARIYPDAGTGSSYYFAEAALLDKEKPEPPALRPCGQADGRAGSATSTTGSTRRSWSASSRPCSATSTGAVFHHTLTYIPLAIGAVLFALVCGYIAYRGVTGSTMTAIVINVIQITCLTLVSILFIAFRLGHGHADLRAGQRRQGRDPPQLHPRDLPVDDRHPAAGRLRVGDRSRRRGDQAGEGHQDGHPAQPDHPGRDLLPVRVLRRQLRRRRPDHGQRRADPPEGRTAARRLRRRRALDAAPDRHHDPQHRRADARPHRHHGVGDRRRSPC